MFSHFTKNSWVFETLKILEYLKILSPQEAQEFQIDVRTINWELGVKLYLYGMQKFILK